LARCFYRGLTANRDPNKGDAMSTDVLAKTYKIPAGHGLSDVWWKTGRMTVKASGAETGGSLGQVEMNDPRGTATPLHRHHNEDETFYVLEGDVTMLVNGERIELSAGDYAFAARGDAHAYIVTSERARMLVTISPAGLEQLFVELGVPVLGNEPPAEEVMPPMEQVIRRFGAYGCEILGPPPTLADFT
jgi:quercetin dioxygenase-like cupin family protein